MDTPSLILLELKLVDESIMTLSYKAQKLKPNSIELLSMQKQVDKFTEQRNEIMTRAKKCIEDAKNSD